MLVLEKEIMEEKLKGFYEAWVNLVGKLSSFYKIEEECEIISKGNFKLAKYTDQITEQLEKIQDERDVLQKDYRELVRMKDEYMERKERFQKVTIDKVKMLQKEISSLLEEREKLQLYCTEIEKKLSEASEELRLMRTRSKKSKVLRSESQEKFCAMCFQVYNEQENFNWSCKTHKSKLCNDRYWCCNGIGKDAPGCLLSKHITNEELLEQEEKGEVIKYCIGCKEVGHSINACPKDPNIQTNVIPHEEIQRLKTISVFKKKQINLGSELQDRAFEMVNLRIQGSDFSKFKDTDDEAEELEGVYFRDLVDLKEEIDFSEFNLRSFCKSSVDKKEDTKLFRRDIETKPTFKILKRREDLKTTKSPV